ncbi:MAG: PhoH family protein [Sulfolobales archaeon]
MSFLEKLTPMSPGQSRFIEALKDPSVDVVGVFGPTGSGKSLITLLYGIDQVMSNAYEKFLIIRPLINILSGSSLSVDRGGEIFRDLASQYLIDLASQYVPQDTINDLIKREKIVFVDLHYLKGRSFDRSLIFIDDIQNMPAESVIETLIRVGNSSKLIVAGDPVFQRLRGVEKDSSAIVREILLSEERARVVDLGIRDVVRPGAKKGLKLLIELHLRNRQLKESELKVADLVKVHAPDADVVSIIELAELRDQYGIQREIVPDFLIITKTPGRLIGRGGERIQAIEKELGGRVRGLELTLEFKEWIRALHPVSWIYKHISEVDFAGPNLKVSIDREGAGPFIGQKGVYIRFIDHFFRSTLGVSVIVEQVERETEEKKEKKKKK